MEQDAEIANTISGEQEQLEGDGIQNPGKLIAELTGNIPATITRDEPNYITFTWPNDHLIVDATRFNDQGEAELFIWHDVEGLGHPELLIQTKVNLLSPSARKTLISQLRYSNDIFRYVHWDWVLTSVTYKVTQKARQGDPLQEIWPIEGSILVPEYLVEPLLYQDHPTVIFGDYGSLKSTVALLVAYVAQLPYGHNGLGLIPKEEASNTLYLDFEGDNIMFMKRWTAISKGIGIEAKMPILYKRMNSTLAESVDTVEQMVVDNKVKFIIIDSLGPAVKGNLNDPDPAIQYNEALRKLAVTSLTLAHNAKDPLTKQRTIFGSVFFTNLARSIWQCKIEGERQPDDNEAIISLKQVKASFSNLYGTLGYRFKFTDTAITVHKTELGDTGLSGELPLSWQIKNALKGGALTAKELADLMERPINTIYVTLKRMVSRNEVYKLPNQKWGLSAE